MKKNICFTIILLLIFGCSKSKDEKIADQLNVEKLAVSNEQINTTINDLTKKVDLEQDDVKKSAIYSEISSLYSEKGDITSSIKNANAALKYYPNDANAYYVKGKSYLSSNRISEALENLQTAVRIKKDFSKAYFELGNCYYKLYNYSSAEQNYILAIQYNSNYYEAYNNLGIIYTFLKKNTKAEKYLLKAIAIKKDYAPSYKNLGILYDTRLHNKNLALTNYKKFLNLSPNASERQAVNLWIKMLK